MPSKGDFTLIPPEIALSARILNTYSDERKVASRETRRVLNPGEGQPSMSVTAKSKLLSGMGIPKKRETTDSGAVRWPALSAVKGATLVAGLAVAYIVAYAFLDRSLGAGAGILATVPAATAAWLFGVRIGIVAALLSFGLNSFLETVVSGQGLA